MFHLLLAIFVSVGENVQESVKHDLMLLVSGLVLIAALIVSGISPYDQTTWLMEVSPVIIALPLLAATYKKYPLTSLAYGLIFLQAIILIWGGAYTYARVPLGFWIQDLLDTARNPYDKIGHFAQGFVPVMLAREILLRGHYVQGAKMVAFLSVCFVMAVSSWYELIEWGAALAMGQGADEFVGTQGDQWDTQSDMFFAFIGSVVALLLLSRLHDRLLSQRIRPE